jgi:hypothetical protein
MDIVTKDFPVVAGEPTEDYPHGTFEVILSAPTLDRDGEVVDSKAFEPLPAHITFDTDHSMTCDSVVGSGVPSYAEDGTLRVKGGYAADERSQTIRQKVVDGHIRTTSVTFMAAKRVEDAKGVPHVVKAELLNGTFTPVPSNRESVVLTAKSIVAHETALKVGARNSTKDAEAIQGVHDASVGLGATCAVKSAQSATVKALGDTDDDPLTLVAGVDASIDQALALLVDVDLTTLPDEVQQAIALLQAADAAIDELMQVLGIPDPDDATDPEDQPSGITMNDSADNATAKAAAPAAAEAAAESAGWSDDESKALAHAIENAAQFAFGG